MARLNLGDLLDPDEPNPAVTPSQSRAVTPSQRDDTATAQRAAAETVERQDGTAPRRSDGDTAERRDTATAKRHDGKAARRRSTTTAPRRDSAAASRHDVPPSAAPDPVLPGRWKFTMLLSDLDDQRTTRVVNDVLAIARLRPTKGMRAEVVRALLAEADQDPELRARLAQRVKNVTA